MFSHLKRFQTWHSATIVTLVLFWERGKGVVRDHTVVEQQGGRSCLLMSWAKSTELSSLPPSLSPTMLPGGMDVCLAACLRIGT